MISMSTHLLSEYMYTTPGHTYLEITFVKSLPVIHTKKEFSRKKNFLEWLKVDTSRACFEKEASLEHGVSFIAL